MARQLVATPILELSQEEGLNIIDANTGRKAISVADAEVLLAQARAKFEEADDKLRTARSIQTAAINELNQTQRDFDAAVARVKADAPPDSDWKRDARRTAA